MRRISKARLNEIDGQGKHFSTTIVPSHEAARLIAELRNLRSLIDWIKDRDDRNGSLPAAYRRQINSAFAKGIANS